ncbi:MAG: nucleotidyltransferase/DNA polymerase protein, partial [Candidatus Paceibacter sp.]|nr:nucleotidyltransferase/DNA polymerase protein [Candidatus Paceibacter sp.]
MSVHSQQTKAIIHIDGDAFFAYCEVAQNERLRGKPVVTGQEKGMAIAVSYEAKALGVSRGMLMSDIRKLVPNVIILSGNYDLYKIISRRMCAIVRRYAPIVEEYSVDECFADISGVSNDWNELVTIAQNIKRDLEQDLGMTFSLGLGPTKTLAKVASKWKKPAGFTVISLGSSASKLKEPEFPSPEIRNFLGEVPIGAVWGIGRSLSFAMQKLGITTALEFTQKSQIWIEEHFSKPTQELWYELRGIAMHRVGQGNTEKHKSIRATRTFRPPSKDKNFILSELSRNAEKACGKLRKHELQTRTVYFYLKTQTFTYKGFELQFPTPITTPSEIMNAIKKNIDAVFRKNTEYRASGIV